MAESLTLDSLSEALMLSQSFQKSICMHQDLGTLNFGRNCLLSFIMTCVRIALLSQMDFYVKHKNLQEI